MDVYRIYIEEEKQEMFYKLVMSEIMLGLMQGYLMHEY